jgi:hypothetical protein
MAAPPANAKPTMERVTWRNANWCKRFLSADFNLAGPSLQENGSCRRAEIFFALVPEP